MDQGLFGELVEQVTPERLGGGVPRLRRPERRQVELRAVSLEDLVAADHRVRLVWRFVEGLDLSRLLAGIKAVEGSFKVGAMVDIQSSTGEHIARGLVEYASDEINALKGQKTGGKAGEVIHRDNMVIL